LVSYLGIFNYGRRSNPSLCLTHSVNVGRRSKRRLRRLLRTQSRYGLPVDPHRAALVS